jgi:Arc/MetJ family transcription regulator
MAARVTLIRIDRRLVDEATRVLGAKSRTEAAHIALREIVALSRFKKLMKKHADKIESAPHDR